MTQKLDYFDLTEHNSIQKIIFWIMILSFTFFTFYILLPLTENFFEHYLKGIVYNSGEQLPYRTDIKTQLQTTNPLTYWAVDIYIDTPQESRNWVNPALALFFPSLLPGLALAIILSTWLPRNIGLIKQKIEREIISELDQLTLKVYGVHTRDQRNKIRDQLLNADLRNIHDFEKEWNISADNLLLLRKAILWLNSTGIASIFKSFSAISFFLKFYITKKYTSLILGTVYFGAAVLLLVIGLRGVKFIPASEPSLLFFALGLEFCLLIIYAVTMMYGSDEDEQKSDGKSSNIEKLALSKEFGSDKEAENLLKVFVLKNKE